MVDGRVQHSCRATLVSRVTVPRLPKLLIPSRLPRLRFLRFRECDSYVSSLASRCPVRARLRPSRARQRSTADDRRQGSSFMMSSATASLHPASVSSTAAARAAGILLGRMVMTAPPLADVSIRADAPVQSLSAVCVRPRSGWLSGGRAAAASPSSHRRIRLPAPRGGAQQRLDVARLCPRFGKRQTKAPLACLFQCEKAPCRAHRPRRTRRLPRPEAAPRTPSSACRSRASRQRVPLRWRATPTSRCGRRSYPEPWCHATPCSRGSSRIRASSTKSAEPIATWSPTHVRPRSSSVPKLSPS